MRQEPVRGEKSLWGQPLRKKSVRKEPVRGEKPLWGKSLRSQKSMRGEESLRRQPL